MNACLPARPRDQRPPLGFIVIGMCSMVASLAGCTSPPSVMPLLQVTEQALAREAEHLAGDAERDAQWIEQTRRSLAEAYDADLSQVEVLTPEWVRDATSVYVLAREELTRHEAQLQEHRQRRADNLQAATAAIRRAGAMLEQQDRLWLDIAGVDAWSQLSAPRSGSGH